LNPFVINRVVHHDNVGCPVVIGHGRGERFTLAHIAKYLASTVWILVQPTYTRYGHRRTVDERRPLLYPPLMTPRNIYVLVVIENFEIPNAKFV
jgi:hypothetical protein